MRSTQLCRGDYDDRVQQLAGEVALQAIRDLRMLRKRGMVKGMKIVKDHTGVPLTMRWSIRTRTKCRSCCVILRRVLFPGGAGQAGCRSTIERC